MRHRVVLIVLQVDSIVLAALWGIPHSLQQPDFILYLLRFHLALFEFSIHLPIVQVFDFSPQALRALVNLRGQDDFLVFKS